MPGGEVGFVGDDAEATGCGGEGGGGNGEDTVDDAAEDFNGVEDGNVVDAMAFFRCDWILS